MKSDECNQGDQDVDALVDRQPVLVLKSRITGAAGSTKTENDTSKCNFDTLNASDVLLGSCVAKKGIDLFDARANHACSNQF